MKKKKEIKIKEKKEKTTKEVKFTRVTTILGFVESAWKEWWWRKVGFEEADKVGREASDFGTIVHGKIEAILKDKISVSLDSSDPSDQCAIAVIMWLEQNKVKPLFGTYENSMEIEVIDKDLGLIGHFDYAALVNDVPTIIDFKTSKSMRKSFPVQKAFYAKMANSQFNVAINNGLTLRTHWDKDSQAVEFEEKSYSNLLDQYWPIAEACLAVYRYFK